MGQNVIEITLNDSEFKVIEDSPPNKSPKIPLNRMSSPDEYGRIIGQ